MGPLIGAPFGRVEPLLVNGICGSAIVPLITTCGPVSRAIPAGLSAIAPASSPAAAAPARPMPSCAAEL